MKYTDITSKITEVNEAFAVGRDCLASVNWATFSLTVAAIQGTDELSQGQIAVAAMRDAIARLNTHYVGEQHFRTQLGSFWTSAAGASKNCMITAARSGLVTVIAFTLLFEATWILGDGLFQWGRLCRTAYDSSALEAAVVSAGVEAAKLAREQLFLWNTSRKYTVRAAIIRIGSATVGSSALVYNQLSGNARLVYGRLSGRTATILNAVDM